MFDFLDRNQASEYYMLLHSVHVNYSIKFFVMVGNMAICDQL